MKRTLHIALVFSLLLSMSISNMAFAEQRLISTKVDTPPVIDGDINEQTWQAIKPVSIKDQASGNVILLRSVYSGDKVYFSAWFSDSVKNPLHKPWIWDKDKEAYETGAHREDTFVFKWNMLDKKVDLSNFSDDNYTADVWYWKANRTNPAGYAEGLLAEADQLGPDWNPPEPEKLTPIGFVGRIANGDKVKPEQTPRGRQELGLCD